MKKNLVVTGHIEVGMPEAFFFVLVFYNRVLPAVYLFLSFTNNLRLFIYFLHYTITYLRAEIFFTHLLHHSVCQQIFISYLSCAGSVLNSEDEQVTSALLIGGHTKPIKK